MRWRVVSVFLGGSFESVSFAVFVFFKSKYLLEIPQNKQYFSRLHCKLGYNEVG